MQITDGRYRMRNGESVNTKSDKYGWIHDEISQRKWYPSGEFSAIGPTEYDLIARLPDYPILLTFKARGKVGTRDFKIYKQSLKSDDHLHHVLREAARQLRCKVSELEVVG